MSIVKSGGTDEVKQPNFELKIGAQNGGRPLIQEIEPVAKIV